MARTPSPPARPQPALLEAAFEHVRTPLAVLDARDAVRFANAAFARALGRAPGELRGRGLVDLHPPERRAAVRAALDAARASGRFEGALETDRPDGSRLTARATLVAVPEQGHASDTGRGLLLELDDLGSEPGRLAYVRLVEDLEHIERAMRGAADVDGMLTEVLDTVLALFRCDRAWLLHPCDPAAPAWRVPMERTVPEHPGAFAERAEVPMSPEIAGVLRVALEADGPVRFGPAAEHPLPASTAERFGYRSMIAMAIRPGVGRPWLFGLHQCGYDRVWTHEEEDLLREVGRRLADGITTLRAHLGLRASERRFRALFEGAADAALLVAADGRILDASRRACESLGRTRADLVGSPIAEVELDPAPPADADADAEAEGTADAARSAEPPAVCLRRWSALEPGTTLVVPGRHRRADGSEFPVETSLCLLEVDGARVALGLARDVSERERAAAEQRTYEAHLRRVQRVEALGRLAAGVAHDLNNLLLPILGYGELLEEACAADPSIAEAVAGIREAASRGRELTSRLLALGRQQVLRVRSTDLAAGVRGMEPLLRRVLRADVELRVSAPAEPVTVLADPSQVDQIVMNLVVNAQDAMPDGGRLELRVDRRSLAAEDCADHPDLVPGGFGVLTVSDTGHGMDEATRRRIFEPFFSTKAELGTGLGLATVQGIVQQHGGNVWVYSEPGRGATFRIYLPESDRPAEAPEPAPAAPVGGGSETVLVVEDDDLVRRITETLLAGRGYEVVCVDSGRAALELVARRSVDLVLTDVIMPDMNGRELAEAIRARHGAVPTVFMSGYTDDVVSHHGMLAPGVHLLEKPFSSAELLRTLRAALDG